MLCGLFTLGVIVGTMKQDARQRISKSFMPSSGTQNQLENENAKFRFIPGYTQFPPIQFLPFAL